MNWIHSRNRALEWAETHPGPCTAFTIHPVSAPWSIRILGEPPGPAAMGVSVRTTDDMRMADDLESLFPERDIQVTDEYGLPLNVKARRIGK